MANYDGAHYFVKDWMEPKILELIKRTNAQNKDGALVISGGDVLSTIFSGPQVFLTHDFDIKAVLKTEVPYNETNTKNLYDFAEGFAMWTAKELSKRYKRTRTDLDKILAEKYGVKVAMHPGNPDYFSFYRPAPDWSLFTVSYRLESLSGDSWNLDQIMDVFAATPETINSSIEGRYQVFIGGEPRLSTEKTEYYIPTRNVDGVLYAGMGYMLWDTEEMIRISKNMEKEKPGSSKLSRYEDKRLAILDDLNHPEKRLNCRFMREYIKFCERELDDCSIPAWNVKNQADARSKLEKLGLIDSKLESSLGSEYVCDYAKRISAYLLS